jgi:hypothetical protein
MLDGGVEDVRQEHKGLVDRLVAERDPPLSALVTNRAADRGRGLDPLTLDDLLAAVLVDQRDRERRDPEIGEEGEQVLPQPLLVVGLRRWSELRLSGEPPSRRELLESRVLSAGGHARRPPHADLDLGEDLLELALGLAHGPAFGVGPERDHLASTVGADAEAIRTQTVLPVMRPNLTV